MVSSFLLVCKYGEVSLVLKVASGFGFDDLVKSIRRKWENLSCCRIELLYAIAGHTSCVLDNDADFGSMIDLASVYGVQCVEVTVGVSSSSAVVECDSQYGRSFEIGEGSSRHVEVEDPLDKFCPIYETARLSADWVHLITSVGQEFRGGVDEFRICLCKYAVEVGFKFKYLKNEPRRVTAECCRKLEGCTWFIHAILVTSNGFFRIKEFHSEHNCLGMYFSSKNNRLTSKIVSKEICEEVRLNPSYRPIEAKKHFESRYGSLISYHHAWLGVEKAHNELYGDFELSFDKLRWYAEEVKERNPGTVMDLEYCDQTNRFERMFLAFDASIRGFNYCRPLLAVDGTFLKGRYKGTLLGAIGKDANQGLFPLAIGIVHAETDENWCWFLNKLLTVLVSSRPVTFLTDRHFGLVKYVPEVFPTGYHSYCLHHLKANLKGKLSGRNPAGFKKTVIELFEDVAYAPSVSAFEKALAELCKVGGEKAKIFVESIPYERWTNAHFKGRRYGEMTSNAAESFNNQILKFRHLPICDLVDKIRGLVMEQMCARKKQSQKWNNSACPVLQQLLVERLNKGRTWHVAESSDDVFEIFSKWTVMVNLKERTCTCCRWQLECFPCVHACTVIQKIGRQMCDYIDPYYTIEAFKLSYEFSINPIPTLGAPEATKESVVILPPKTKRQAGRPRTLRARKWKEKVRPMTCGRCGVKGKHNRRTCKEAVDWEEDM